ncbi:MAG: pyridoxal-dependent decarboxylase [Pyrinomonadaceae bacterium]
MIDETLNNHLAWFLGPKAENADVMETMVLQILRDYFHWRKNYFPGDPILINKALQRSFEDEHDSINQNIHELMAELRRNFPFYSPRYIAHELSDTLMPSVLGYIAGMLFNPNNVTPEAAPVTTELEIDACNSILSMLGFTLPPSPPPTGEDAREYYKYSANKEFGWAHITSGGTVANIEALWVAKQVRYFPLSVQKVAKSKNLNISIKLPNGESKDIRDVEEYQLTLLKPNESIYLLPKYIKEIHRVEDLPDDQAERIGEIAWKYLNITEYSLSRGTGVLFSKFQPTILVAGTRHYSISKAADVIGIGQQNILSVRTDKMFRIDIKDLEKHLTLLIKKKKVPLCVVATAGTTEEGAIDSIHEIIDLRAKMEKNYNASFWLHIDAAWGGFIRSLFNFVIEDKITAITSKVSKMLNFEYTNNLSEWHNNFGERVIELLKISVDGTTLLHNETDLTLQSDIIDNSTLELNEPKNQPIDETSEESKQRNKDFDARKVVLTEKLHEMSGFINENAYERYLSYLERFPKYFAGRITSPSLPDTFDLTLNDLNNFIQNFVTDEINILPEYYNKKIKITWPPIDVGSAFLAFPKAESITIDPHKLGYAPYPCGCIAFKNDRVRLFVLQKAPYITASKQDSFLHMPPRHTDLSKTEDGLSKIVIDSFSPFILEGSKPGAAAAALWLAVRTAPLTMRKHGMIIRASLLAARELYEWLVRWNEAMDSQVPGIDYQFISLTPDPPDTNLVTFVVKKKTSNILSDMNKLTKLVYERFTIQSELGEREYSYSQPFFLSNTIMDCNTYPTQTLEDFFRRCGFPIESRKEYEETGLVVLRASVMNPYITASRSLSKQDFIRTFIEELSRSARKSVRNI